MVVRCSFGWLRQVPGSGRGGRESAACWPRGPRLLMKSAVPAAMPLLPSRQTAAAATGAVLLCAAIGLWFGPASISWCRDLPTTARAKTAAPCADNAYRQFDFWVGNWDVVDADRPGIIVAHARVEAILNGCVLHEVYVDTDGHKGESFSIYDATRKTWHQSWVTDRGQLLTIEGHLQGAAMILEGTDHLPDGTPRRVRGEWRSENHGVREVAARSTDGGATWVPWFDLSFQSHKPHRP